MSWIFSDKNKELSWNIGLYAGEITWKFNKSISLRPNYYEAYKNMGNVLQDKCRFEDALEAYKKTLLFLPNDAGTYNGS